MWFDAIQLEAIRKHIPMGIEFGRLQEYTNKVECFDFSLRPSVAAAPAPGKLIVC